MHENKERRVKIRVPASSANLGTGFDVLGIALDLYLTAEVAITSGSSNLQITGEGSRELIRKPEENLFIKALALPFKLAGQPLPEMDIRLDSQIPFSRGLGSSAAAAVAGLSAANVLLGGYLSSSELLNLAVQIEGHADNVAAALAGGMVCVMVYKNQCYIQSIPVPNSLGIVLAVPDYQLPTGKARAVLPEKVSLSDSVFNLQRCCYLMASFFKNDLTNLDKAMDDMIYQPSRSHLIPGFVEVVAAARQAGAVGAALSGAGPSVMAFCQEDMDKVGKAMVDGFAVKGIESRIYYLKPDQQGAYFL